MIDATPFQQDEYRKFLDYIKWYEEGKKVTKLITLFPSLFVDTEQ